LLQGATSSQTAYTCSFAAGASARDVTPSARQRCGTDSAYIRSYAKPAKAPKAPKAMVVHDYNWILGSDAALDCVAKCLTIIYGEDEAFALPPKRSLAYYDALWTWWTRLRPVDVEPKLAALVASCHADAWLSEDVGGNQIFVAPSYSILGLLLLAAGARAPRDLAHALVSAARRDCRRVLDLGAPAESFAHGHRSELVKRLFAHDFGRTDRRELVREPFGPRELQLCAKVAEGALTVGTGDEAVPPWFPSQQAVAPRLAVSGLGEDACAPWCGAPTLFALAERREAAPYAPPPRPALSPNLPALGGLEVLDFAPTAAEAEAEDDEPPAPPDLRREAPDALETLGHMGYEPAAARRALAAAGGDFSKAVRALERECRRASGADPILNAATGGRASAAVPPSLAGEQSCDVCGAGNCKRRCGRCREAYYCSEECQRSAWPAHKEACAAPAAARVTPTKL